MLTLFGIAAAVMIGTASAGYLGGLRLNLTPSYALGLWRIARLDRAAGVGDLVLIRPPPTRVFVTARERGYLRSGLCPGWLSPLIKTIVAMPGQRIEIAEGIVEVCRRAGIQHIVSVFDARMARIFHSIDCAFEVIGTPACIGKAMTYAGVSDTSDQMRERPGEAGQLHDPVLASGTSFRPAESQTRLRWPPILPGDTEPVAR